jgi:hypothetical protein
MSAAHDNAVFAAVANLERSLAATAVLRRSLGAVLPTATAAYELDGTEDHVAAIERKLRAALRIVGREVARVTTTTEETQP